MLFYSTFTRHEASRSSSYHGQGHAVYLMLVFGFMLPEGAVAVEIRHSSIRTWQALTNIWVK